jgi:copper chaperone
MENSIRLSIEGMHCGACVRRVINTLAVLQGVHVDSVDVGSAKMEFDPSIITPGEIEAAIDRIGFKAHAER